MSIISIDGLTVSFPGRHAVQALRGVDLRVPDGSVTAVLGPSGCGKTTLLRSVAGLERPDSGSIRIGDRVVDDGRTHLPPEGRAVGLVPQEGALFPHLDVAGNVGFGLNRSARADRRRRVADMLELVGLPDMGSRRPHQLSGGQQQRVALARALAPEPAVVLLDEPFSALDTGLRTALRAEVASLLHRQGTTAVLVTHDQVEAMTMADRLAVMREGRIVQVGSPDEVYRRPVDPWIGMFLGDAVRIPGRREGDREAVCPLGRLRLADDVDHHEGTEVCLFLRPEQIRPVEPEPAQERSGQSAGGAGGAATALVTEVRFQGPDALVDLELAASPIGGTRAAGTVVTARWPSTILVDPGSTVAIRVEGPVLAHAPDHDA